MKILITHSYFLAYDPKEALTHKPYPPLAPLTLAGWIKKELDLEVQFYDVMFDKNEKGLVEAITRFRPDVLIAYDDDFNFLTKMCLQNMRNALFRVLRQVPQSGLFIAHGSDASDQAEAYLKAGFDLVVHRNAEKVLVKLLEIVTSSLEIDRLKHLPSISYLEKGKPVHNPLSRENFNPEDAPMPRWDIIDLQPYRETWISHHGFFSLNLSTAQGCPFHCNWCAKPLYGRTYRSLPPEKVADQVQYMTHRLGAQHLWITDDIFALKPGWLTRFADELERRGLRVPYKCLSRADLISEEFAEELGRSGCQEIWLGVESGSQKILDAMEKGLTVEDAHRATRRLRKQGIAVGFFIQFGYPGEGYEDIRLTWKLIRSCLPDFIGISISYPLKGTPFYEMVKEQMGEKKNWSDSGDLALMFPGAYPPEFYRALYTFTHQYFGWQSLRKRQSLKKWLRRLLGQLRRLPVLAISFWNMQRLRKTSPNTEGSLLRQMSLTS